MTREADLDALLTRAQDGDLRAFELLLAAYLPQVRRYARAFAGAQADADDLAQEALLKVFKRIKQFRYQSAFSTWLFAVVRNSFLDSTKGSRGRQQKVETEFNDEHAHRAADAPLADEAMQREEERRRLWDALRSVPEEFRSALVLFDIEGHSYDELAAIEGVPVGTVKSRLFRGRALLRKLLGEPEEEEAGTSSAGMSSKASGRTE